jgi:hypothetical protein
VDTEDLMSHDDAYVTKMQKKIDEWREAFATLQTKAESAGGDAKVDFHKRAEGLASKAEVVTTKIAELRLAGKEQWDGLKREVGKIYGELRTTTDRMARPPR